MRDKRPVDELTVEELERILAIKKREERQGKLKRMERAGRIVAPDNPPLPTSALAVLPPELERVMNTPTAPPDSAAPAGGRAAPQFEDEVGYAPGEDPGRLHFWRSFMNQSLLLVEVAAIAGLAFLGYQMITATTALQRETASAQALADEQRRASLPTLAPTPEIQLSQVVLPGGHIFTDSGDAQFNYDEVPETLRYLVASQILQPVIARPQRTPETAVAISIPKLNIDQTIVQGTDWEALKLGVAQFLNGVNPGDDRGNLVLAAHNDIYGEYFRYLDQLESGDEIIVRTATQVYYYTVTAHRLVKPTDISVMETRDGATITLISCYPYKVNTERYIVFAERTG